MNSNPSYDVLHRRFFTLAWEHEDCQRQLRTLKKHVQQQRTVIKNIRESYKKQLKAAHDELQQKKQTLEELQQQLNAFLEQNNLNEVQLQLHELQKQLKAKHKQKLELKQQLHKSQKLNIEKTKELEAIRREELPQLQRYVMQLQHANQQMQFANQQMQLQGMIMREEVLRLRKQLQMSPTQAATKPTKNGSTYLSAPKEYGDEKLELPINSNRDYEKEKQQSLWNNNIVEDDRKLRYKYTSNTSSSEYEKDSNASNELISKSEKAQRKKFAAVVCSETSLSVTSQADLAKTSRNLDSSSSFHTSCNKVINFLRQLTNSDDVLKRTNIIKVSQVKDKHTQTSKMSRLNKKLSEEVQEPHSEFKELKKGSCMKTKTKETVQNNNECTLAVVEFILRDNEAICESNSNRYGIENLSKITESSSLNATCQSQASITNEVPNTSTKVVLVSPTVSSEVEQVPLLNSLTKQMIKNLPMGEPYKPLKYLKTMELSKNEEDCHAQLNSNNKITGVTPKVNLKPHQIQPTGLLLEQTTKNFFRNEILIPSVYAITMRIFNEKNLKQYSQSGCHFRYGNGTACNLLSESDSTCNSINQNQSGNKISQADASTEFASSAVILKSDEVKPTRSLKKLTKLDSTEKTETHDEIVEHLRKRINNRNCSTVFKASKQKQEANHLTKYSKAMKTNKEILLSQGQTKIKNDEQINIENIKKDPILEAEQILNNPVLSAISITAISETEHKRHRRGHFLGNISRIMKKCQIMKKNLKDK